jgi:lantibiotic modifying enzyme
MAVADEPCLPTQVVSAAVRRTRLKEPAGSRSEFLPVTHASHEAWLAKVARVRLERQVSNLIEALTRTFTHLRELPVERAPEITAIGDIEMLGSESHNEGRRPVLIRFSPHQAVVYKPVNLQIDHLVSSLLSDLADRADGKRLFATLSYAPLGKDYGFVAYASTARSQLGRQAARRFYLRFGALVAVAYSLNITDLHMENVLAVDEHPVLIDFETALYRFPDSLRPVDITMTGLVEQPNSATPNSGLQGGGACRRWALSPEREQERPIVGYREPYLHLANRRSDRGGALFQPAEFRQDLLAGFELGYRLAQRHRDLLRRRIALSLSAPAPRVRHILRFTSHYLVRYFQLLQPSAAPMDERERELRTGLENHRSALDALTQRVLDSEVTDLLSGDVPYFWTDLDSRDLQHRRGLAQARCFATTPLEALEEQLQRLSAADLREQRSVFEKALLGGR